MHRRRFLEITAAASGVAAFACLAACGEEHTPSTPSESSGDFATVITLREALERMYGERVGFAPGYSTTGVAGTVVFFRPGHARGDKVDPCEEFGVNGWFAGGRIPPNFTGPVNVDTVMVRWDPMHDRPVDEIELLPRCDESPSGD